MTSISILKLNKLHILLPISTYELRVNIICYVLNIFCVFRLIIYVLFSFTYSFSTFHIGLLFTHTVAWVNTLSSCFRHIVMCKVVIRSGCKCSRRNGGHLWLVWELQGLAGGWPMIGRRLKAEGCSVSDRMEEVTPSSTIGCLGRVRGEHGSCFVCPQQWHPISAPAD